MAKLSELTNKAERVVDSPVWLVQHFAPLLGTLVGGVAGGGLMLAATATTAQWQAIGLLLAALAIATAVCLAVLHNRHHDAGTRDIAQSEETVFDVPPVPFTLNTLVDNTNSIHASEVSEIHRHYAEAWHELRTPMSSVIGYLELASEQVIQDPKVARYLAIAQHNAEHVLQLTDDILSIQHGTSATALTVEDGVDLAAIARESVEMARPQAAGKAVTLQSVHTEGKARIVADPRRIRQVIDNLLANAIKYTRPHTEVTVTVTRELENVVVSITDHGVGMTESEVRKMLTPYFRTDAAVESGQEGTGLGMGIVHRIVASHGGQTYVDTILGHGTTVSVKFPHQL